ncbi:hypothetical protein PHYSODRAFT_296462 [Phytophthora sojae]|uniref:Uncharacterized protein n=1 Tax=Phytophthora sojae (strain P6497) TaxID=1094619 RepID=G4YV37_PHYSP|nr:hypothetical protein PHYSODRAFT_296462 [Phytophthora sojae]EGZ24336.1 hypothetical protein PHYSODRAFT_296462 [Phytophthora sojae]|eukprot:XP_009519624.1 hypothetical protein PHYSODRAFT_296462 [Phytophthora sojae]
MTTAMSTVTAGGVAGLAGAVAGLPGIGDVPGVAASAGGVYGADVAGGTPSAGMAPGVGVPTVPNLNATGGGYNSGGFNFGVFPPGVRFGYPRAEIPEKRIMCRE